MRAEELLSFIETKMKMSHVYQPLLIRSLLDRGNASTTRDLAVDFSLGVASDVDHYEDRIIKQPVPVLARHGVIEERDGRIHLLLDSCSDESKQSIRSACEEKVTTFLRKKKVDSWAELRRRGDLVPSQNDFLFPTLHALRELGGTAHIRDIADHVAKQLTLSQQQIEVINPTADDRTLFEYRLAWARTELKENGGIANTAPSTWSLVNAGQSIPEDELAESLASEYSKDNEGKAFELFGPQDKVRQSEQKVRTNQARFRFDVLTTYGVECALCSITEARLIEAAHIVPKSAQGSDDVRNGLPLCLLHHKASESDVALIRIEPDTLNIVCEDGRSFEELKVTKTQLQTRTGKTPRKEALQYLWDETATYLAVEPAYRYNLMYPKHERP
jgi:hypothetical protein